MANDWRKRQKIANGPMAVVLRELCYQHQAGKTIFPSQRTIAERAAISPRSVFTCLRLLEAFGVIGRRRRFRHDGGRTSDEITLALNETFDIDRKAIAAARRSLTPPRKGCDTPSQGLRRKEEINGEELSQRRGNSEVEIGDTREGRPRLTVVSGGLT